MLQTKVLRGLLVALISVMMSHVPEAMAIEMKTSEMIPTMDLVDSLSRTEMESQAREFLNRADLQDEFKKYGIDPKEAAQRLATLSQTELQQLVKHMDEARLGGSVVGILVVVVLVLLVIYLAKRV